jgi:hypothetical protein
MTENEWLASDDLRRLLRCLCEQFRFDRDEKSHRKMRLFACALARTVLHMIPDDETCMGALVGSENFADGNIRVSSMRKLWRAEKKERETYWPGHWYDLNKLRRALSDDHWGRNACWLSQAANEVGREETWKLRDAGASAQVRKEEDARLKQQHLARFRDIFGNPFRAISSNPAWLTANVRELAQTTYEERELPEGALDPARLAILADALEEAGCDNADILGHLRGRGEHVRGCWALDLILRKM